MTISSNLARQIDIALADVGSSTAVKNILNAVSALSGSESAFIDGVTAGTAAASKAVVLDASKDVGDLRNLDVVNLDAGASGTAGSVDVFPATASKGKLAITKADNTNNDTTTVSVALHGQATTVTVGDVGLATSYVVQSTAQITAAEADVLDGATAGTQVASKAVVADANVNIGVVKATELHIGATGSEVQVTATAAELNQLDGNILADMATVAGVGITGTADNFASSVEKVGTLFKTTIVVDLGGLNSGGTANDIIGADGAGVAHLGQITAARNGTIFAGLLTCLETPATGDDDIDLYSAVENTGVEDTLVTDLTETQLCNSGDLTSASRIPLTAFPAANEYLYLAGGVGDSDATYSAGILVIELWGR